METKVLRSLLGICALLSICLCLVSPPIAASSTDDTRLVSTTTRQGRLVVFDDVWETIDERYYDPSFRGLDWFARGSSFRPIAANATSTQEFYEILRRMIAPLKDAHTRVYSPEEKFDWWKPTFVNVGLSIREIEGKVTVVQVESSSPAKRAGIHAGDVLQKIDGVPAEEKLANKLEDYGSNLDESIRFRALTTLLEGSGGSPVKLEWQERTGKTKSAILQRERIERVLGFQISQQRGLLVIRIDAFTPRVASDLERGLGRELKTARGVILDLRANGGGDAQAMADVASVFLPSGTNLGRFSDRSSASFELHTSFRSASEFSPVHTDLPLVVLTSESTSSAAEILAAALQKVRRARLIGTQTCGCVLAIRNRHTLPDGGVLDVSELDYWTSDGARLEGVGVTPDDVVKTQRRDLYTNRDSALELARISLKALIK